MDEEESTFDSFIVATDSQKRKSLLPINKTTGTDASDLDILEESGLKTSFQILAKKSNLNH